MNEHARQDFIMNESTQNEKYIMQCKTNVVQQWCNVAKMNETNANMTPIFAEQKMKQKIQCNFFFLCMHNIK
jgi:hypothetical protein